MLQFGTSDVKEATRVISKMGQRDLQSKFKLVYGTATHSNNNEWLRRKLFEAIGALPIKVPCKARVRKTGCSKKRRARQKTHTMGAERLVNKRTRYPSQKLRDLLGNCQSPCARVGETGLGVHIHLSKDGVFRSRSLPLQECAHSPGIYGCSEERQIQPEYFVGSGGSGEDSCHLSLDPFGDSMPVLPGCNSLPVVFGSHGSTNDLTELVRREEKRMNMEHNETAYWAQCQDNKDDEVLLLDIDSATCNPVLDEVLGRPRDLLV